MRIGHRVDRAADAAVAAVGTAARNELLTAETERPAAAVTCLNVDVDFVDELHGVVAMYPVTSIQKKASAFLLPATVRYCITRLDEPK